MDTNSIWTMILMVVISCTRVGMGIYGTLSGPTLLFLAGNVGVSVSEISIIFLAGCLGILLGGFLGGIIKRSVGPNFRHLFTLGIGVGIIGLEDFSIPWITHFWLLICVVTVGGTMYGYLDAGLQALILQLWGEEASRPHIQLFHFMYSVGAFLSPLIAAPFLTMANADHPADSSCPQSGRREIIIIGNSTPIPETYNFSTTDVNDVTTLDPDKDSFNPVTWAYIISATWLFTVSFCMILLSLLNVEKKVQISMENSGFAPENRDDEPICDVLWLFILIILFYFCCGTVANVYFNFIYSVTVCSELNFTPAQASAINSVFWIGAGLGRLSGLVASKYMKPQTILMICILLCIADMILMCLFGKSSAGVAWAMTAVHGYSTSILYPTGVSWISQYTNVSGTYMFIFNLGSAMGSLSMLAVAGVLFDMDPFNVMYLSLALAVGEAVIFLLAMHEAKRHERFLKNKLTNNTDSNDSGTQLLA